MKSKEIYSNVNNCRLCGGAELLTILNLGDQPPANSLRNNLEVILLEAPLGIMQCLKCRIIQLNATVEPKYLFDNYVWVTGTSLAAKNYSEEFAKKVLKSVNKKRPFIVEIASNDGTFLRRFQDRGCKVLGVDPAKNIATIANDCGVETATEFFTYELSKELASKYGPADIVIARNVIPHVKEIHSIVEGMAALVDDNGVVVIEFHYAKTIADELH
jgi:predicted TPR repeat methyltransferase